MRNAKITLMKYLWTFLMALLVACTEITPNPTSVEVTVKVAWPAEPTAQNLPSKAQSVWVTVAAASAPQTILHTLNLDRPQASGTIQAPVGEVIFSAQAFDQVGSQGQLLAQGRVQRLVAVGAINEVNLSLSDLIVQVRLSLASAALKVGQTTQATASALDASGAVVVGVGFNWSSSNPSVASVDGSGKVTALAEGNTLIRASEDRTGKQATASLSVAAVAPPPPPPPSKVERIELGPGTGKVPLGGQVQLLARAFDKEGKLLSDVGFSFSSSNPRVLSLTGKGKVQAAGLGQATVRVEAEGKEALATLEVVASSSALPAAQWAATEPPEPLKGLAGISKTADGTRLAFVRQAPSHGSALFRFSAELKAWAPLYPNISEIEALNPDPSNNAILVSRAGTVLYRSANQGLFWQTTRSDPELAGQALQRHPANPQVLLAGRFRSADGGVSWTKLDCDLVSAFGVPIRYAFAPQDASRLYCYSNLEVMRSSNGGSTWQAVALPEGITSVDALALDPEGTLHLAGFHSSGTPRTSRLPASAQDWVTGGDVAGGYGFFSFAPSNPDTIYLHGGDALTVSKNGGNSWTTPIITGEFQPDFSEGSLRVDPANPTILYTYQRSLTNPVWVLRSSDAGSSWSSTGIKADLASSLPIHFDGSTTFIAGSEGLWASTNNGQRFSKAGQNKGLTLHTSLGGGSDSSKVNRLLSASFLGLSQSSDGGQTWGEFDNRYSSLAQAPSASLVWYGAGVRGDVLKSGDGGQNWNWVGRVPFVQPEGTLRLAVSPSNAEVVYAAGMGGVYQSRDGGASWQWASRGLERVFVTGDLVLGSATQLFVATREGVYKSDDGAQSWSPINVGLRNLNITQLALAADGTLFAGANDGGVYRSLDASTWEWVSDDLSSYRIQDLATDLSDANVLYAATIGGIYKSINKGSNWLRASQGLTTPFVNWLWVSPDGQTLYLGSNDQGLFGGQPADAGGADFRIQSLLELRILEKSRLGR
jgi:photosystem II stability/assembly factor-like uncharacterized protein